MLIDTGIENTQEKIAELATNLTIKQLSNLNFKVTEVVN